MKILHTCNNDSHSVLWKKDCLCFLQVLQVIPDNWSIGLLSNFLSCAIRKNMHTARTTHVERMLARGHNIEVKAENLQLQRDAFHVSEER